MKKNVKLIMNNDWDKIKDDPLALAETLPCFKGCSGTMEKTDDGKMYVCNNCEVAVKIQLD